MIVIIRGLIFLTTLTLLGIYGLECFVLVSKRFRGWARRCLLGLLAATAADLLQRIFHMTGSWSQAAQAIHPMLFVTHVGHVWIVRSALVLALLLLESLTSGWKSLRLMLAMLLGVTIAVTGHAADRGDFTVHVLMDSVHVIAAGLWVGGLFGLAIAPSSEPETISRFSTLAGCSLGAVIIGGAFNTWVSLPTISALWATPYGRILSMKLLAVSVLVVFGAVNRYVVLPDLKSRRTGADVLFKKWIRREVVAALVVIILTAVLTETIPSQHALHTQQETTDTAYLIK